MPTNTGSWILNMDVSVIIVSYNTAPLTIECLASLHKIDDPEKEIFVVDNFSTDNSAELITTFFPRVTLIVNDRNRGFGAASNQALPCCRSKYIIYLNPDTTVRKDTLKKAVSYMDINPQIGLAGAKILNPDGSLQPSVSYKYPGEKFTVSEPKGLAGNIACVMGAFMIARTALIEELKGFDEDFFLYGEDQDLCWRIRRRNFAIGYITDAEVLHWGGQSEMDTLPAALFAKKLNAEYLFYRKHYFPETIDAIKRAQRLKSRFRLAALKLELPFSSNKQKLQNKIDCYRIALGMAKSKD
jgi:GT2 family glycosyltransferase